MIVCLSQASVQIFAEAILGELENGSVIASLLWIFKMSVQHRVEFRPSRQRRRALRIL